MSQWKQMHMMRGTRLRFLGAVMLLLAGSNATAALEFVMNDSTRCFEEEIHEQVLVVGEYAAFAFREQISNVLRSLNATTSDREHVGFLKQRDVDELVSELEPNKNLTNVSDDEQEEQVVHYFQTREENFLRLHEDDPKAVLEFQRQAHDVVEKFSLREMFLGLVHQRVHLPLQLTVTDPDGKQIISRTDDTESAFTFDAKRAGIYECCIRVLDDPRRGWSLVNNRGKKVTLEQLVGFLSSAGSPMKVKYVQRLFTKHSRTATASAVASEGGGGCALPLSVCVCVCMCVCPGVYELPHDPMDVVDAITMTNFGSFLYQSAPVFHSTYTYMNVCMYVCAQDELESRHPDGRVGVESSEHQPPGDFTEANGHRFRNEGSRG